MIGYGNTKYTDTYLLFKAKKDVQEYVEHQQNAYGVRFYARDIVDYHVQSTETMTSLRDLETLTIETPSNYTFQKDDWLLSLKDGKIWRINDFGLADDGQNKRYSSRPRKVTRLQLEA